VRKLLILGIFYNISGRMGFLRNCSLIIFAAALLSSCTGKVVCPAYSSYFMLDQDYRDKHFAYFGEDSLPNNNVKDVEKTWYGTIAQPKLFAFYRKNESLKTVPMELVFADVPDSLAFAGDELMYAEMDVVDSTRFQDEEGPANKWNWNVEQEYYFRRIKDMIITEEEMEQGRQDQQAASQPTSPGVEEEPEKKGFFARLFGKKEKTEDTGVDDTAEEEGGKTKKEKPPKEKKKKEKKGLFGKKNKDDQPEPEEPEKKEDDEDEGEGF